MRTENASENKESRRAVDIAVEMREGIVRLAGPRSDYDSRERMIERAARAAGITYRTAKALYYREISDPRYSVVDAVRAAVAKAAATQEEQVRAEYQELAGRLDRLEARLADLGREAAGE